MIMMILRIIDPSKKAQIAPFYYRLPNERRVPRGGIQVRSA